MNEKNITWEYCPFCGYGLMKLEKEEYGADIYLCLNCNRKIPKPKPIWIGDKEKR
ncbi:MAG TPA: hypothetical protein VMW53_07440 [archaeon]|nr:hypothetical protein [archaeon]